MRGKEDEQGGRSYAADEGAAGGDLFPAERLSAMRMVDALVRKGDRELVRPFSYWLHFLLLQKLQIFRICKLLACEKMVFL